MSKANSGLFSGTSGSTFLDKVAVLSETFGDNPAFPYEPGNTAIVWKHIKGTQDNYIGTVLPKSFTIDTPQGKMWTHPNATKHMNEAVTSIKIKSPRLINSNPNMYSQFILYDYWKNLSSAVNKNINYNRLVKSGNWEFKFARPRESGKKPVVIHAKFNGLRSGGRI